MIDLTGPLDRLPDPLPIEPLARPFDLTIVPPGSKSITCRAYVLAALAEGQSRIVRPLRADDTDRLLDALCTLGAEARWDHDDAVITGVGGRFSRGGEVNLGDGGAPTRFMIAAACLAAKPVIVDGSPRMRQRPIAEGVDLLRRLGADIRYLDKEGCLPVRVTPRAISGGEVEVPTTMSSQFISALLLVAGFLPDGAQLTYTGPITSESYVDLTRAALADWGVDVQVERGRGRLGPVMADRVWPARVLGRELVVEPDASSAAYWFEAAAIVPDSKLVITGVAASSPQPDFDALVFLETAGVRCDRRDGSITVCGPPRLGPIREDAALLPDAAVALAAAAAMADSASTITGLHTLRVKETDRLAALASELGKLGCTVEATDDSITIDPATRHDRPAEIETYHDHRMAMAFGVLGLARPGISVRNPACVSKSYPSFWRDFARVYDAQ